MAKNFTAILHGKADLKIEDKPAPDPKHNEVLLSIRDVGICGSDVHMYTHGTHGTHALHEPTPMGHEASAVVVKVGECVTSLKIGDRVALEPGDACNECKNCMKGAHNMCLVEKAYLGDSETGYITQNKIMKAAYCHKLPDNVSDEEGAVMEPLAVAVHDCRRGEVQAGKSVLVLGAGTIGLLCMAVAKAMGATNVCITDVIESRLKLAKEMGATHTLLTASRDIETVTNQIHNLMGGAPDIVIECSGITWCQQLAIMTSVAAGCVVLVGYGDAASTLPIAIACQRQIDLRTSWRYDRFCYSIAIDLVSSGRVNVAPIVTHRFPLLQTDEAIKMAASRDPGVLKVMINCNEAK